MLLGGGNRVQRPVLCDTAPSICRVEAVFRLRGDELGRVHLVRPGNPRGGFPPGPIGLLTWGESGGRSGHLCRTHPNGARDVVGLVATRQSETGVWTVRRTWLRYKGAAFRVVGRSRYRSTWDWFSNLPPRARQGSCA